MQVPVPSLPYSERTHWFHKARFGLFIHYGLYSVAGWGEWLMFNERMPVAEYARLADGFAPAAGCADEWTQLAVDAGMRYAILTTRHHDGFSLFRSPANKFNLWNLRGRDLAAEFAEACRRRGLKVGFYYSLLDWRFPGYFDPAAHPKSAQDLVEQIHAEVRHLMSEYGSIDVLWYDGGWVDHGRCGVDDVASFWRSAELNQMVYDHQPSILINNRSGLQLDLDTPEQVIKASAAGRAWESCMTIGDSAGWGWLKHNPNRKTLPTFLQNLVSCAADEGNFLINVGPRFDGSVPAEDATLLGEMGSWLTQFGDGIYGSQRSDLYDARQPGAPVGRWTRRDNVAYLHVFRWPGRTFAIPLVRGEIVSAVLLPNGSPVRVIHGSDGRLLFDGLPDEPPHPAVNVIQIQFSTPPTQHSEPDHTAWISAPAAEPHCP